VDFYLSRSHQSFSKGLQCGGMLLLILGQRRQHRRGSLGQGLFGKPTVGEMGGFLIPYAVFYDLRRQNGRV
jgi:hypothetical protein